MDERTDERTNERTKGNEGRDQITAGFTVQLVVCQVFAIAAAFSIVCMQVFPNLHFFPTTTTSSYFSLFGYMCVCVCVDICRYGSVSVHAYQLVGLFGYVIYRPGVLSSRGEL